MVNFVGTSGDMYGEYRGLSTDKKPTNNVETGEVFLEIDTGNVYMFDGDGKRWIKQ